MGRRPPDPRRNPGRMRQRATASPATTSAARSTGWRAPATFSTPPDTGHIIEPVSANPTGLAAHGYVEQEYFASGTAYSFASTVHALRREVDHRRRGIGALPDAHHRAAPERPGEVRRERRRGVDERVGRRVRPRLGLPRSGPHGLGRRLRGGVRPGARRQRREGAPRLGVEPRAAQEGAGPLREPAPPRRPVLPRHVRPDRSGAAGVRHRRSSEGCDHRTCWPSASPSRRST